MEEVIREVILYLRAAETSYGSLMFYVPKHIAEKMNKKGVFQVSVKEIKDFKSSYNRVVVETL